MIIGSVKTVSHSESTFWISQNSHGVLYVIILNCVCFTSMIKVLSMWDANENDWALIHCMHVYVIFIQNLLLYSNTELANAKKHRVSSHFETTHTHIRIELYAVLCTKFTIFTDLMIACCLIQTKFACNISFFLFFSIFHWPWSGKTKKIQNKFTYEHLEHPY